MILLKEVKDMNAKLTELHKMMLSRKASLEDVSETMYSLRPEFLKLIDKGMKNEEFSDNEKQIIFMIIEITQYMYNYSGYDTGLSDTEYDKLYEIYINLGNEDIISVDLPFDTTEVGYHKYKSLRGTLSKIYYLYDNEVRTNPTRKYLSEWFKSREREIFDKTGKKVNLKEEKVYVFPKWDGVSCIFEFNPDGSLSRALTRGNVETNEAQVITKCFPNVKGKVTDSGYGLKTEIMMRESDLDYYNEKYHADYKNTRSVVSSILNSDSLDERNDLLVIQKLRDSYLKNGEETLQELDDEAFNSPFIVCKLGEVDKIKDFAEANRYVDGLRCDGAVIYIINEELRRILGRENNKNKYEVAYKFTEEIAMTTLEDVIFQMGLFGNLAPIAVVKPVKLKGNTIQRISLGSVTRFNELRLRKGDKVKVLYDIIPYLVFDDDCEHNDDEKVIKSPKLCPACGEKLEKNADGYYAFCTNLNCDWRKKGVILNYLQKMDIPNISTETVNRLYEEGFVKNIKDIYSLKDKKSDLLKLDGFGELKTNAILEAIDNRKNVPDYQLLGAIGIPGISTETCKKIMAKYSLDEVVRIAEEKDWQKFTEIPGIKDKKAKKIAKGFAERLDLISFLRSVISVTHPMNADNGKFSVVFTKIRDEDIEKDIIALGGIVSGSVKKTTNYLVVPNLSVNSAKVKKARKYGIRIVPIDDIIAVITEDLENE